MIYALIVVGYLVGSLPFGLLVARWFGKIDIRTVGSGNIGATNVGRVMGLQWFFVVFLLDLLKGLLPTLLASWQLADDPGKLQPILVGGAAVMGHMFPCYLNFRGGKGVATGLGVVLVLAPMISLVAALIFGTTFGLFRMVSLSSILASIGFAVGQLIVLKPGSLTDQVMPMVLFSIAIPAMIIWRHRSNIVRLLRGEEHAFRKLDAKEAEEETPSNNANEDAAGSTN